MKVYYEDSLKILLIVNNQRGAFSWKQEALAIKISFSLENKERGKFLIVNILNESSLRYAVI